MTKQGADMIPVVTLKALALEIFLRPSLVAVSVDPGPGPNVVKMHCFESS
jgi:hypothetical protein